MSQNVSTQKITKTHLNKNTYIKLLFFETDFTL